MSSATFESGFTGLLRRRQLESQLDEAFGRRLTTVTADAGFGKSTTLKQWTEDVECIWYTVRAYDRSLAALAHGLNQAIQACLPSVDLPFLAVPTGGETREELFQAETCAGLLCDALEGRLAHDVVLVLDDVHEIETSAAAVRLVESLCRQAPTTLHIVLASRSPQRRRRRSTTSHGTSRRAGGPARCSATASVTAGMSDGSARKVA